MRHILLGLGLISVMAGCGDPLRNVTRLSDVNVADGAASVAQTPAEARNTGGGLFSRLMSRSPDDPTNAAVDAAIIEASAATPEPPETEPEVQAAPAPVAEPETERRGLFGGLFRRSPDIPRAGPDLQQVSAGTVMPFGQIARVCGMRGAEFGTQVDAGAGYKLFDTIPKSTSPRPFYLTGFDDNCARTFTGAVVITGDVQTHEFVRYRPSNEAIPYTTTDATYEALKAGVCRVGRGQPCGPETQSLNRNTQFITVYNFFGGTFSAVPTEWAQILVHDGEVLAMSIKDGQ